MGATFAPLYAEKTGPTILTTLHMLFQLFQTAKTPTDLDELLQITFTESERAMILERWRIYDAFDRGLSQREVAREVPCSIVTATRGAKNYRAHKEAIQRFLPAFRALNEQ